LGFTGEKDQGIARREPTANTRRSFMWDPKIRPRLEELAEYLELTVDYGFLWMLAKPIFAAMKFIHEVVGNWGWSIILLTIGIKILLYPLVSSEPALYGQNAQPAAEDGAPERDLWR